MTENMQYPRGKRKDSALPWFRFYTEALDDPKVQRLPPHLFKTWVNLLCLAGQNGGKLPSIDDMAFKLRMSAQDAEQQISDLILAGLIDITETGRAPHNWAQRQFVSDSSTERVRKHRKIKAETACNVSETATETAPDTEAETEQNRAEQKTRERADDETPAANVKPVENWRTAFASQDDNSGITIAASGKIILADVAVRGWLEHFAGDGTALNLALIEVAGKLQPNSHTPLAAQASRHLATIARERHDRSQNYVKVASRNAKPAEPANGKARTLAEALAKRRAAEAAGAPL